jgi:hypothetical protein
MIAGVLHHARDLCERPCPSTASRPSAPSLLVALIVVAQSVVMVYRRRSETLALVRGRS